MSNKNDDKDHFERLLDKMDELVDAFADMRVIVAKQEENIRYHIKRTDLLEDKLETDKKEILDNLKPVQKHVLYVEACLKVVGAIALILGLFESAKALFS